VFRYAAPKDKSHYEVRYCCVASSYGLESDSFHQMSAYRGEIAVDAESGVIVRLTVEADLGANDPISRAAIAVEYGPVELGGRTYICPVNSVSISVAQTLKQVQEPDGRSWPTMGPPQVLLNHVVFDQYHLFRSESRVLTGSEERAAGVAPDATLPSATATEILPADEELADAGAAKPAADANGATAAGTTLVVGAGGETGEISTAVATALPEGTARAGEHDPASGKEADQAGTAAAKEGRAHSPGFTMRVSSRLVDVNVVALDKKGRPITDLKPGELEIYDNGVKQDIRFFSRADSGASNESAAQPVATPKELTFSNRARDAKAGSNTVVLLLDASNLAYPDLADARQQMLHFLQTLQQNERVALYVSRYHGFQVLVEPTTDHAMVATHLANWKPSPQDMANAQDEEQRNRQQVETVHSPEDLLSVNGNYTMDSFTQSEAMDAKLREMGNNPGPNALSILVDVAHHLAVVPGHKSLVWVTSDNALADWNKLSVTIEKGARYIEPVALRTQEAMNNAHVSVYPLDASRLEAAVISPTMGNRNVELTPTFQRASGIGAITEAQIEGPEATAGQDMNPYNRNRDFGGNGRLTAQMQQDMHPIQGVFREVAEATGGRALRRSNNMIGQLNGVVDDGHATYLASFSPKQPADGQYHVLTVKLAGRKDVTLRYRTGYKYDKEPTSLKERFTQALWQPADASEIAVSTKPVTDAAGNALRVTVAGADLDLAEQSALWTGKVDIFLVRRDEEGLHAKVSGMTVGLKLKPATYQRALTEGLTFDERLESIPGKGSLRVVVVDVNSGRIGSVTVPSEALEARLEKGVN
jgi:VWFA-related protein